MDDQFSPLVRSLLRRARSYIKWIGVEGFRRYNLPEGFACACTGPSFPDDPLCSCATSCKTLEHREYLIGVIERQGRLSIISILKGKPL